MKPNNPLHKTHHRKQRQKQRKQIFRKWHRRIGFTFSLIIFNLAITGILLNHYESLSLHKSYVKSEWLLDWYNIKAPDDIHCFKLKATDVCQIDSLIYAINKDQKILEEHSKPLVNVVQHADIIYMVTNDSVYINDQEFNLIDKIDVKEEFSSQIKTAFIKNQQLYFQMEDQWLVFDETNYQLIALEETLDKQQLLAEGQLTKNSYQLSDKTELNLLKQNYRQKQMSYLKLLQDLHSGRILAQSGKLLTDITGIALLLLAISGFITWQRRKNGNRE